MSEVSVRPVTVGDETFLREVFADGNDQLDELALLGPDVRELVLDRDYRAHFGALRSAHPRLERFVISVDGADVGSLTCDRSSGTTEVLEVVVTRSGGGQAVAQLAQWRVRMAHGALRPVGGRSASATAGRRAAG